MKQVVIFLFFFLILFPSCSSGEMKFDKAKWEIREDAGLPSSYRKKMLNDLTTNYKLVGIKYSQLVDFLGEPNLKDSISLGYDIVIDFGHDIDPVYIKTLKFSFSKDSVISSFKIVEWEK
jgi:outer membrane receptor for ferrienterochelin and colicin